MPLSAVGLCAAAVGKDGRVPRRPPTPLWCQKLPREIIQNSDLEPPVLDMTSHMTWVSHLTTQIISVAGLQVESSEQEPGAIAMRGGVRDAPCPRKFLDHSKDMPRQADRETKDESRVNRRVQGKEVMAGQGNSDPAGPGPS